MAHEPALTPKTVLTLVLVSPLLAVLAVVVEFMLVRIGLLVALILVAGPMMMSGACVVAGMAWGAALTTIDRLRTLLIVAVAIAFTIGSFHVIGLFDWLGISDLDDAAPLLGAMVGLGVANPVTPPPRRLLVGIALGGALGLAAAWWYVPEVWELEQVGWLAGRVGMVLLHGALAVGLLVSSATDEAAA